HPAHSALRRKRLAHGSAWRQDGAFLHSLAIAMMPSAPGVFTPLITAHTIAAVAALILGPLMFLRRKGTSAHRRTGYTWVTLMLVVILSSFFIRSNGSFSWTHLLSVGSLVALVLAFTYARRHQIG